MQHHYPVRFICIILITSLAGLFSFANTTLSKPLQYQPRPFGDETVNGRSTLVITTKSQDFHASYGSSNHLKLARSITDRVFIPVTKQDREKIIFLWLLRKAYSEIPKYSALSANTQRKMQARLQKSLNTLLKQFSRKDKSLKGMSIPLGSITEIHAPDFLSFSSIYWERVVSEWDALEVILLLETASRHPLILFKGAYLDLSSWAQNVQLLLVPKGTLTAHRKNLVPELEHDRLLLRGSFLVQQLTQSRLLTPISLGGGTTALELGRAKLAKKLFKKPAKLLKKSLKPQ